MKKIFLILVLSFVTLFMAGCSTNGSPKSVAKDMVKRLSNEKYDKIEEIFYQPEDCYFDSAVFKALIKDKGLDIAGNKKIKVKEVGKETKNSDGKLTSKVKISIDDNKTFILNTIEIDGKWYVNDPYFYDSNITIVVPSNTKVKINGKTLGKKYKETKKESITVQHPDSYNVYVYLEDVEQDYYVLKNVLKGTYNITVEGIETIKDEIVSYSDRYSIESDNYTHDYSYTDGMTYRFVKIDENTKSSLKTFINSYLNDLYEGFENRDDFDKISKYFDLENDGYGAKSKYNSLLKTIGDKNKQTTKTNEYYDSFKVEEVKYHDFEFYNDDNIAVTMTYKFSYQLNTVYSNGDVEYKPYSYDYKLIAILSKEDDTYKINNGYYLMLNK